MDIIRDTESLVDRVLGKKVLEDKKEEARRSCGRRRCAAILDGATPDVSASRTEVEMARRCASRIRQVYRHNPPIHREK